MGVTYTPLKELSLQQLDKVLEKFQLVSRHHDQAQKIQIIKCIGLYDSKLSGIPDDDIVVGFNKAGNLHDMKSNDDSVKLMEEETLCNICSKKVDSKQLGVRCAGCSHHFHNKCTGSPVTLAIWNTIIATPHWVKVFCPRCMDATQKTEDDLQEMKQDIEEIKEKVTHAKSYSNVISNTAASKQLHNNLNNLVNTLHREKTQSNPAEEKLKQDRTIIVKRYSDKNIRNSGDVRKEVNKEFPGSVIRNARTTAGGSIVLEFDDTDTANNVANSWKNTMFGGNKGVMRGSKPSKAAIIKHVYTDHSDEDIKKEITGQYPNCEVDLFMKSDRFTGTMKVSFSKEEEYKDVMDNRIKIFRQRYVVEPYIFKPRVIKCNYCQKLSHVERLCRSENPVCGKCTSTDHETKDCEAAPEDYKCYHCNGNHETGHKECRVIKEKEAAIKSRFHNV